MDILVTGSEGFIGKYLINYLTERSYNVIPFDIIRNQDICNYDHFLKIKNNVDLVIHLASVTFVPDSYKNPKDFYQTNVLGLLNVLEFCRQKSTRLIYLSSYTYGSPEYLPIDEKHTLTAFNPYAGSKIIAEDLCRQYNKFWEIPLTILRPFNIYGFGQKSTFLIPQIIEQAMHGLIIVKDTSPKRDYIHVNDVVTAIESVCRNRQKSLQTFNIGTGASYSVLDIINHVIKHFPDAKVRSEDITRPNEVMDTVANISNISDSTGWKPEIEFYSGLDQMISAYRNKEKDGD